MSHWWIAAALCCMTASVAADDASSPPVDRAMRVTTDAPEYCDQLAARVQAVAEQHPRKREQATDQIRDGRAQCAAGHVEIGVYRLRVVLRMLDGD